MFGSKQWGRGCMFVPNLWGRGDMFGSKLSFAMERAQDEQKLNRECGHEQNGERKCEKDKKKTTSCSWVEDLVLIKSSKYAGGKKRRNKSKIKLRVRKRPKIWQKRGK